MHLNHFFRYHYPGIFVHLNVPELTHGTFASARLRSLSSVFPANEHACVIGTGPAKIAQMGTLEFKVVVVSPTAM